MYYNVSLCCAGLNFPPLPPARRAAGIPRYITSRYRIAGPASLPLWAVLNATAGGRGHLAPVPSARGGGRGEGSQEGDGFKETGGPGIIPEPPLLEGFAI